MKKHSQSLIIVLAIVSNSIISKPAKARLTQRSQSSNEEGTVRWVQPNELKSAVRDASHSATDRAMGYNQAAQQNNPEETVATVSADSIKPDMLLSLRNLLNFLASSHIKTGLPTTKNAISSPSIGYTQDGTCVMVSCDGKACKWNVVNRNKLGDIDPSDVQKGSNISPDGSKKAFINDEERIILVDTKTGEKIIGPSVAGYQIMLGKPKLSWSHINPVWCPNGKQCAVAADGLIVFVDVPHLIEVDTFIKGANENQLAVLEKIHNGYRNFDKTGKVNLAANEKQVFNAFPGVVTKALKPYIQ